MMLPHLAPVGLLKFILFIPIVPLFCSAMIGIVISEVCKLLPHPYVFGLIAFYCVTLMFEYITLFDMIFPNFSWK